MHRNLLLLIATFLLIVAPVSAQTVGPPEMSKVDFAWVPSQDLFVGGIQVPGLSSGSPAYAPGFNSGARSIAGPVDLDGDGKMEVVLSDYSGGGRLHVIESVGVDTWELIYSSPTFSATVGTQENARGVGAGDLDGDGKGEVFLFVGYGLADESPVRALIPGPRLASVESNGDNSFNALALNLWDFGGDESLPDRWRIERMTIFDVDGDDTNELLFGNNGRDIIYDSWYIVTAEGLGTDFYTFTQEARFTSLVDSVDEVNRGGGSPYGILPADLDGDGTYELVLNSYNNLNFSVVDVTGADTYASPSEDFAFARGTDFDAHSLFGCTAVDIDRNGDDEVYCPIDDTGDVALLNYEDGENPLEIRFDPASPETNNLVSPIIRDAIGWGIGSGDIDGDGSPELFGTGPGYTASRWEAGESPRWVTVVDYNNFYELGVEHPSSYKVRHVEFPYPEEDMFTTVNRDSAGVKTTYFEGAGGRAHQFVYLGDVDGDGANEVAMTFQAISDSVFVYDEVFNPADSTYTRTATSRKAHPHRAVMRVLSGDGLSTSISNDRVIVPEDFELHSNYPNPFNPSTTFSFMLPLDKRVSVRIYDMTGRLVRTLVNNEAYVSGTHSVTWNGLNDAGGIVASGQYIYTLEWGQFRQARRMVLVK